MTKNELIGAGRGIAIVTGAAGGIGAACARRLGADHALFLVDIDDASLARISATLKEQGATIAGTAAADLSVAGQPAAIIAAARETGPLTAVVHAAGLSPSMGDARGVLAVNWIGTEALLDALEDGLEAGLVAVVIASMAGHLAPPDPETEALLPSPGAHALEKLTAILEERNHVFSPALAYNVSKRANIQTVMRRAARWGADGARIMSISPGLVDTRMGRMEVEAEPQAAQILAATPLGWVQPEDIAETAAFIVSGAARKLTGSDIRVDSGSTGMILSGGMAQSA